MYIYLFIFLLTFMLLLLFNLGLLPTVAVSVRAFDQLLDIYGFSPCTLAQGLILYFLNFFVASGD